MTETIVAQTAPEFHNFTKSGYEVFLNTYVELAFPESALPPSAELADQLGAYLNHLTFEISPPPAGLFDQFLEYAESQHTPVEGLPTFSEIRLKLEEELFPVLHEELDLEPLNPSGVEQAIVLFNSGGLSKFLKELIKLMSLLAKAGKKLRSFEVPEGYNFTQRVFRKDGPFKLLAVGETQFFSCKLVKEHYNSSGHIVQQSFTRKLTTPSGTAAITAELSSFMTMVTKNRLKYGESVKLPEVYSTNYYGPVQLLMGVNYSLLKSTTGELYLYSVNPYSDAMDRFLSLYYTIELKYWALDGI